MRKSLMEIRAGMFAENTMQRATSGFRNVEEKVTIGAHGMVFEDCVPTAVRRADPIANRGLLESNIL